MTTPNLPANELNMSEVEKHFEPGRDYSEVREEYRRLLLERKYQEVCELEKKLQIPNSVLNKCISDLIFEKNRVQLRSAKDLVETFQNRGYNERWIESKSVEDVLR